MPHQLTRGSVSPEKYRPLPRVLALMGRGEALADRGDYLGAVHFFDRAAELDPLCVQAPLYRAGLKLLAGDARGALSDFESISGMSHAYLPAYRDLATLSPEQFPALMPALAAFVSRRPDCAWARVYQAFTLRALWRYDEAVAAMDRALEAEPRSAALWALRSRVKLTNDASAFDGESDLMKAAALEPSWGWLRCWLGEALRHRGRYRRALRAHDEGLRLDPGYRLGYAWRGGVLVALGRPRRALADFRRYLEPHPVFHSNLDPEHDRHQKAWAYNQRMLARRQLGDTPGALQDLNRAHRLEQRYGWVFNPARSASVDDRGIAELDRAARRHPRSAWIRAWRGWTLERSGRFAEAIEEYRGALRLSPRLAWPRAWLGRLFLTLQRPREAGTALGRALRDDPRYAPAWISWAETRRRRGRFAAAARDYTKAIGLDFRSAPAHAGRGECWLSLGRWARAEADFDRALAIYPRYAQAYGGRAESRRRRGDLSGALRDADEALAFDSGMALVYVTRSLVKRANRDYKGQIADFRRAVALRPELLPNAAAALA